MKVRGKMKDERFLQRVALYSFAVMMLTVLMVVSRDNRTQGAYPGKIKIPDEGGPEQMTPVPTPFFTEDVKQSGHAELEEVWEVWNLLSTEKKEAMSELLQDNCIIIKRPEGEAVPAELTENLLTHSMKLVIQCGGAETVLPMSVLRVADGEYFFGQPQAPVPVQEDTADGNTPEDVENETDATENRDLLAGLGILSQEENGVTTTELHLTLNGYYLAELSETEEYYVISLKKPKDIYKKIVVVDAGHGGHDPGAGADNWRTTEASINLKLLRYLKEYLDADEEIQAYYTRTDNSYPSLAERVELANGVAADLFVSFHCNSTVGSYRNGTEIMYNAEQGVDEDFNSGICETLSG